jgi:hypothetical protein
VDGVTELVATFDHEAASLDGSSQLIGHTNHDSAAITDGLDERAPGDRPPGA